MGTRRCMCAHLCVRNVDFYLLILFLLNIASRFPFKVKRLISQGEDDPTLALAPGVSNAHLPLWCLRNAGSTLCCSHDDIHAI